MKECCEKCNNRGLEVAGEAYCTRPSCSCHQVKEEGCKTCYGTGRYGANGSELCPDCSLHKEPDWEKEFDEYFHEVTAYNPNSPAGILIKKHIYSLLSRREAEARTDERSKKANYKGVYQDGYIQGRVDEAKTCEGCRKDKDKIEQEVREGIVKMIENWRPDRYANNLSKENVAINHVLAELSDAIALIKKV